MQAKQRSLEVSISKHNGRICKGSLQIGPQLRPRVLEISKYWHQLSVPKLALTLPGKLELDEHFRSEISGKERAYSYYLI